jgi:hypothetical protein
MHRLAECITVALNEDDVSEPFLRSLLGALLLSDSALRGSLGVLGLSAQSDQSVEELLGWIAGDIEGGSDEDTSNDNERQFSAAALNDPPAHELRDILSDRYLNVAGAKLVPRNDAAYHRNVPQEKLQRIYSLGLVFYQLFSGGELPPAELLVVSSPNGQFMNVATNSISRIVEQDIEVSVSDTRGSFAGELGDFASALDLEGSDNLDGSVGRLSVSVMSSKRQSLSSSLSSIRGTLSPPDL